MKKSVILVLMILFSYIFANVISVNKVFAVNQVINSDINGIDNSEYPQIKDMINRLKESHPNWNFKILYTDIDWDEAIANEYVGHGQSPRNLSPYGEKYDESWICPICGIDKEFDRGEWYCASEDAIRYMMDPRNSLNATDLFQFMELSYIECSKESVQKMVENTFLNTDSIVNTILDSAKKFNVNPYYVVARMIQEQGRDGSILVKGQGYDGKYVGLYNPFNIGANGNGKETVIINGFRKAEAKGWNTLEKGIIGGIETISKSYISKGQNTLYLQKFDVDNSDGELYWHQYMQNILAAQKEGQTLRDTFKEINAFDGNYTFIIPVFKNMPLYASPRPSNSNPPIDTPVQADMVRVNVNSTLTLRDKPGKSGTRIGIVSKGEILTRLEKANARVDNTYWDYIMKADGTKGYVARETYEGESEYKLYLVPVINENGGSGGEEESQPNTPENNENIIKNEKVQIDKSNNSVILVPNASVKDISNLLGKEVVIKKQDGSIISSSDKLGTGYILDDKYKLSVLGDVNGDGKMRATDYMAIKNHIMEDIEFKEHEIKAADVNRDGRVRATDYMAIKNHIMNDTEIKL